MKLKLVDSHIQIVFTLYSLWHCMNVIKSLDISFLFCCDAVTMRGWLSTSLLVDFIQVQRNPKAILRLENLKKSINDIDFHFIVTLCSWCLNRNSIFVVRLTTTNGQAQLVAQVERSLKSCFVFLSPCSLNLTETETVIMSVLNLFKMTKGMEIKENVYIFEKFVKWK